jgi:cell division protease FtsH
MEGLNSATDVTFLLTTNRADLIEPALAARPGRVDLAAELPLPDASARRALIRLYQGAWCSTTPAWTRSWRALTG